MESKHGSAVDVWLPALAMTLALWVPSLTIFCYSARFLAFSPLHFLCLTGKVAIPFMLALALLLAALCRWRHFDRVLLVVVVLIVQIWMQGEVFACFYSKFSVMDIWRNIDDCWLGGVLMLVSLFVAWAMVRFRVFVMKNRIRMLLCVVCWLAFSVVSAIKAYEKTPYDDLHYKIDEELKYDFGRKDSIIVVVVDCMGKTLFEEMQRQFPEVTEEYKDFTLFRNMLSDKPKTAMAVPGMFTGIVYPGSVEEWGTKTHARWLAESFKSPTCIFPKLQKLGYRCEGYPLIAHVVSLSTGAFVNVRFYKRYVNEDYMIWLSWRQRMLPMLIKAFCGITSQDRNILVMDVDLHNNNPDDLSNDPLFRQRIMNEFHIGDTDKCFKYYHLFGAHEPLSTDENLNDVGSKTTAVRQLRGSFKALQAMLEQLKKHGLYDRSMIVVTGDHSETYQPEVATLIKLPGQRQDAMSIVTETTHLKDIGQSILAACGIETETDVLFPRKKADDGGRQE